MANKARDSRNFYANLLHVLNTFVVTAAAVFVVVVAIVVYWQFEYVCTIWKALQMFIEGFVGSKFANKADAYFVELAWT